MPDILYWLIYGIFFSDLGFECTKNKQKNPLKFDQLTGHFQSFFFAFFISKKKRKTCKVNQQSV